MRRLLFIFFSVILFSCSTPVKVLNRGIAGNNTNDLLRRVDTAVVEKNPDLVILLAGTNDMINSGKFVTYSDYERNMRKLADTVISTGARLILVSSPPVDTGYIFKRHAREKFSEAPNEKLDSIARMVKRIAAEKGQYFVDLNELFKSRGEPNRSQESLIVNAANMGREDGIHPTLRGYALIASELAGFIRKNKLHKKTRLIICFGDSITYGAFMEGAGTSNGNTYPAVLARILNGKEN